jgi:multidrug efflux pump
VEYVTGFTGGGSAMRPTCSCRSSPGRAQGVRDEVINRLREKLKNEPGARLFMVPSSDVRIGGRQSMASYEYTLQADDTPSCAPGSRASARCCPLPGADRREQRRAGQRPADHAGHRPRPATRLGLTVAQIDNTLNDAFGQRQVGVIYNPLNQYRVVMEAAPVPAEPRDAARLLLRQQPGSRCR